jgi:hypothetical protein
MELGSNGIQNKGSGGAPTPPPAPSGVLFKTIEPSQYTSYRTGDECWRVQNGLFDYTPPTNPAAVAELDMTSASFFNVLKSPLIVNGVSSTTRFVDVDGVQTFSATGNKNLVVIDKLTGLMYTRTIISGGTWNSSIDNALAHSIIVNSITYDDWFLPTIKELSNFIHHYASVGSLVDTLTSVQVIGSPFNGAFFSSTTYTVSTTFALIMYQNERYSFPFSKTNNQGVTYVRNARNLITAP